MAKKFVQMGYDFDTALGNNNEGEYITRRPGLEDTDILGVKDNGDPDYVFNGQESVLHNNERDAFFSDICSLAQDIYNDNNFTADEVNRRMDAFQEAFPERMYNRDADYKYVQEKDLRRAHGSKQTSRTKWLADQFEYKYGQYKCGDANKVQAHFRAYSAGTLTITRLKDGYINILYASTPARTRATRNVAYPMTVTLGNLNDAEVGLYQVRYIKAIEGMPDMYPGDVDLDNCVSLEEIILGKTNGTYTNTYMTTTNFNGCRRAKKIVLNGCTNAVGTLEVPDLYRLEHIDVRRTGITGVNVMQNGPLKVLYASNSLNTLKLIGLHSLETLSIPAPANITSLWVDDCDFDVVDALNYVKVMTTGSRLRLIGLELEATTANDIQDIYDDFNRMTGIDHNGAYVNSPKECVSGTVHLDNATGNEIAALEAQFPYMTVTADHVTSFCYYHATSGEPVSVRVIDGGDATYTGSTPTKAQDAQYTYSFIGWSTVENSLTVEANCENHIVADRHLYPVFSRTVRQYTYRFVNDGGATIKSATVDYGTAIVAPSTPTSQVDSTMIFKEWSPAVPATCTGNVTFTAVYKSATSFEVPTATTADGAYGVEWDYSQTSPALTRKGLAASFSAPSPATSVSGSGSSPFDTIAPWKDMKVYNVVNGTFIEKGQSGFSMTDNDTVVYIPEFYYTAYKDDANSKWLWAISPTKLTGYEKHPGSGRYVGRYHTGGDSSGVYTKSGVSPLVNTNQTNFRSYSKAKGSGWYMMDIATWSAIQMLYLVEYANFDSQTMLGKGWNTGSVGMMGGTDSAVYHTVKATGAHNQYRWIEDPFSNCYDWIDGVRASTSTVYIGVDNDKFNDGTNGMVQTALKLPSGNEIKNFGYDENACFAFIPSESVSNSSYNTYVCDHVNSYSSLRPGYVGGNYNDNANYGLWYSNFNNSSSNTNGNLGSRLLLFYLNFRLNILPLDPFIFSCDKGLKSGNKAEGNQ